MAKKYILDLSDYQVSQLQTLAKTRKFKVRIIARFHLSENFISFLARWSKTAPSEHRTLNFANLPLTGLRHLVEMNYALPKTLD